MVFNARKLTKEGRRGYEFFNGALLCFCIWSATLILVGLVFWFLFCLTGIGTDDSDKNGWTRSGLAIYTDHRTGVQYVGNDDGLHVRVDKDGKPVTR